jgi:hypothetical protein
VSRQQDESAARFAAVRVAELDVVATSTSAVRDPYAALSWYGARLSDLAASLCAAEATPS